MREEGAFEYCMGEECIEELVIGRGIFEFKKSLIVANISRNFEIPIIKSDDCTFSYDPQAKYRAMHKDLFTWCLQIKRA